MVRVQLVVPDEDRTRFVLQAHREGMTLSAWLHAAARDRLERQTQTRRFKSHTDLEVFFDECDSLEALGTEPDWDQHHTVMNEARRRGESNT